MRRGAKSLVKWGWWLQSIHKVGFIGDSFDWVVKELRWCWSAWAGFGLHLYIRRLRGIGSPNHRAIRWALGGVRAFCGGVEENRQRRFNSQLSAVSNELLAKATAVLDGIRPTLGDETAKDGDTRGFGGGVVQGWWVEVPGGLSR